MKVKFGRKLLVSLVTSALVVAPVYAAPKTESLESQKAAAENEASALQQELVTLLDEMGKLEEDLISKGEEIIQAEEDLDRAKKLEEEQHEAMKLRIKYMYEEGTVTALQTLVSAESFSDLLNKAEYVAEVHVYDRSKLKEYADTKQNVEDLKEQLEEEQSAMQSMQKEYEAEEVTLTATLEEKREEIAGFDQQIQAAAEAAAREAEERAAAEKEAAKREEDAASDENGQAAASGNAADTGNESSGGQAGGSDNTGSGSGTSGNSGSGNSSAPSGNTSAAQTIVNAAYSQLGVPYVYGGNGNGGWDCSGLVQYCHSAAGYSLPRTSQAQGGCGVAVSDPQPGDIVCYGTHVGIYIGGGQMIHAPKPGDRVKIAAVYGSPWYRRCW